MASTTHKSDRLFQLFLVEDNPAEVRLITEAIKDSQLSETLELSVCYDGEEALETLTRLQAEELLPDLVLLDLNLPKLNGKEVLRAIKGDTDLADLSVFILTNSDSRKDVSECYELKADGYFQKPTEYAKLVQFFVNLRESIQGTFSLEKLVRQNAHLQPVS